MPFPEEGFSEGDFSPIATTPSTLPSTSAIGSNSTESIAFESPESRSRGFRRGKESPPWEHGPDAVSAPSVLLSATTTPLESPALSGKMQYFAATDETFSPVPHEPGQSRAGGSSSAYETTSEGQGRAERSSLDPWAVFQAPARGVSEEVTEENWQAWINENPR